MYSYSWDAATGGLLLSSSPLAFSKEPRPVYYKELDVLGFDKHWQYAKSDAYPYMWAEANNYFYRGRLVAKTKGGSMCTAPEIILIDEPEPDGAPLRFVDIPAMVEKNRDILEKLASETIRKIYNIYVEYMNKVDVFYVAFSGGKDSIVTLDLVQRALPHNKFKVLFGDTGMEFPDTYKAVEAVEQQCIENNVEFLQAKSDYSPAFTWKKFGPPATVTRWCCSVHKTAPQVLKLREYTGLHDFIGMAFIGIRASESLSRSEYDYISLGEKHKGQYSCNPILEWNSAELYLYIFMQDLYMNEAYKKGNRRVGCLVCPRAAERNDYMSRELYSEEYDSLIGTVRDLYKKSFSSTEQLDEFIANGGWKARKNGRDISIELNYSEQMENGRPTLRINNPQTDWKIWIKTIGVLLNDESPYKILFRKEQYIFDVIEEQGSICVSYSSELSKKNSMFVKLLKNVFRKAACCIRCRECEVDCQFGCINMDKGVLSISDDCRHCALCHKVEKGCLIYKSLEMPRGGLRMSANRSLNCYSHHAPKMEWFNQYFNFKESFAQKHSLGSQMYSFFRRFLRDAGLLEENGYSSFAGVINNIGLDNLSSWALMLTNLAYTPQINWLIKRVKLHETVNKEYTLSLLVADGAKESWVGDIWSSYSRILALPFSEVGLGVANREKNTMLSITRNSWQNPEPRVILYSLFKFAEACGNYYQFTLSRLLNHDIDSDGVSPTEIFGLEREQMEKILNGLSINYPDFINASFTLDLDNITLNSEKTAQDVLNLF